MNRSISKPPRVENPGGGFQAEALSRAGERLTLHEIIRVGVARSEDLRLLQQVRGDPRDSVPCMQSRSDQWTALMGAIFENRDPYSFLGSPPSALTLLIHGLILCTPRLILISPRRSLIRAVRYPCMPVSKLSTNAHCGRSGGAGGNRHCLGASVPQTSSRAVTLRSRGSSNSSSRTNSRP
jgi:hypothetical protein